jgi:MHS family shikimate/dehydroshikimate transporter-like MFS transporter
MALGTASFFALAYLSDGEFASWGWRIPFVASAALVVIGVFIRLRIEETPDFKRVLRDGNVSRFPVIETICSHPKDLIIGLGARITRDIVDLRSNRFWLKLRRNEPWALP